MDGKENTNPQAPDNKNLQKLAHVFDDGLSVGRLLSPTLTPRAISALAPKDEFKPPTIAPNTQTRIKGQPVDIHTAKNLRLISLGYASHSFTNDWKKFFFSFRETKSGIPYGLDASLPGPRSLTLCVQAWVLKNLMFASDKEENQFYGKELKHRKNNTKSEVEFTASGETCCEMCSLKRYGTNVVSCWKMMRASRNIFRSYVAKSPRPTQLEQTNALVEALVDVLWNAAAPLHRNATKHIESNQSDKKNVVVTLVGFEVCFQTKRLFVEDGFTEKLWIFTMHTRQELKTFMRRNIHYFCSRIYPAAIMILYSVILSRTFDVIMKDLGTLHTSLLTDNARSTQSLVNLFLTGNAAPYLHNGVICCDAKGQALTHPLPGLRIRSTLGFLFFNKNEAEDKRTQVGCMYKTPLYPVWVTQVNGTFGILFCTSRDLVTDWKTERLFSLHYFNGHFTQKNETILTLDTRRRVETINTDRQITIWDDEEDKEKKQPSLENLIFTKWPGAEIDWNGESPYY